MKQHLTLSTNPVCDEAAVVRGARFRITVLTPALLRLEYSETGVFEDRATQTVIDRRFSVPDYETRTENGVLILTTEALELRYDQKIFSENGLQIRVKALPGAVWHYGQALHDLKGTCRTLDEADGAVELGTGVLSREGFSVLDDSRSMALTEDGWIAPRPENTDLYFFGYGHRYLDCLKDFYHLCGPTPLLPKYALGNWWSRYYRYTGESYKTLMRRFQAEGLPFTVAVIDMDWHLVDDVPAKYGDGWTGYTWNRKFFPDPEGFLNWLHDKGMKATLNVHPALGVRAYEDLYSQVAEAMGIDPATEQPVAFDPADPKFMEVYLDVLSHSLEKQGVDFWWVDWQQGTTSNIPGLDPLWILNHFHYLDSKWKGTRPLTFSRYAGPGSHRYPVGFSGDTLVTWASLDFQPYFTSTASNIGYGWWSHDIGGHMLGARDDELMARWVQFGVFSPIHRLHSTCSEFAGKEPWNYDAGTKQVMERYLRLRHSLIPYLYTMNRRAHQDGLPLVQPLYYLEPEQEEAYQVPNEYYFGSELLVSPITTPSDAVSRAAKARTWLPEGLWVDFFSGMVYHGGRMLDLWRDRNDIPVLMKAGAIVPMRNQALWTNGLENPGTMEVRIFPAADNEFVLWEDAGDTPEDQDENWASTRLVLDDDSFTICGVQGNREVLPQRRSWKLAFYAVQAAEPVVTVDGTVVQAETAYDAERQILTVKVPEESVMAQIEVRFADGFQPAKTDVVARCYSILLRAQMAFPAKDAAWHILKTHGDNAAPQLCALEGLSPSVLSCLLEVLQA